MFNIMSVKRCFRFGIYIYQLFSNLVSGRDTLICEKCLFSNESEF